MGWDLGCLWSTSPENSTITLDRSCLPHTRQRQIIDTDLSFAGADTESLDGYSVGTKDNITIAEDDTSSAMPSYHEGREYPKVGECAM